MWKNVCARAPFYYFAFILGIELSIHIDTTTILSDASNQELRNYQASLRRIKNRTSTDLQENVYQNRTQFIKISKEADKLKGEMRVLRSLMSELTSSLNQSLMASSIPEARASHEDLAMRARKHTNRSSVANLEAMWNVQLQALWKNVEGSQKFLPAIPGRHVVHESGYWVELDAATWKARRPAHIFLLNDHLLIATKKKRRVDPGLLMNGNETQGSGSRLIADKCWPLENIEMVDITPSVVKDRSEMSNAISIRNGPESFTYRFEKTSNSEKANVLLAFRRTADELRKSIRADVDGLNSKIMGDAHHFRAQDSASADKVDWSQSMKNSIDRLETFIEVDGKHQNLRWVEGQIDELDSEVALQMFEDAVLHVEKLRRLARGLKGNASAQELISMKVGDRAAKISGKQVYLW